MHLVAEAFGGVGIDASKSIGDAKQLVGIDAAGVREGKGFLLPLVKG